MRHIAIASILLTATVAQADPTTVFFDPPSALETHVAGISANGVIAGDYRDKGIGHCRRYCGFVRDPDGSIETFRLPAHKHLMGVVGLNGAKTVVGFYYDHDYRTHGFLHQADGTFVDLRVHGHDTDLSAINDSGVAAGRFKVGDVSIGHWNGFIRLPDGRIEIFRHDNNSIDVNGINASGVVVGTDSGGLYKTKGYTRAIGGDMEHFTVPKCGQQATARAIDDEGDVAGGCSIFDEHAYLRDADGTFHVFDVPGFTNPEVGGVARVGDDTQVVGQVNDTHQVYGFVRHKDGTFDLFSLSSNGKDGTYTRVTGIAPSGAVVGYAYTRNYRRARGYIRMP